ncbi:short-chain dehydrogenase [Haloprofundus marisrubri]|uniref:Short-chain dehydrogenase n=1 Tax=Haloprofundus marisrubri TaxID=1514971 RepID=A0A0W1R6M8_9EURY|nr:glucose 1-dehydrogenase [Haloprofundus marisrubri]KTG09064.1 short-chain dehydrogenase [Haloprofundus marisrubri]
MTLLEEKVAIVTGGGSGIGRVTAQRFAEEGASVVVADVNDEHTDETVSLVEDEGGTAIGVHADVTDMESMQSMVDTAVEEFGSLDIAFNNAGIGGDQAKTADYTEEKWTSVIDVNLTGVWRSMKAELGQMADQEEGGVVVNNASILGKVGFETAPAYVSAKHGVLGLTKTAALEYADDGIRVNAVCPGFIDTPLLREGGMEEGSEMRQQIEQLHAMNRLGTSEEVADAVTWLCSDGASFATGGAYNVDGGFLAR